jgi:hypothetical protein
LGVLQAPAQHGITALALKTEPGAAAALVALADRIELWPVDQLRPHERNPRTHSEAQVDQIAASMVEFGWTNPILVDENAGILAGHGRLLAARKLWLAEVPVIRFEHLSEAQKRAYLIADNQLALQAGWSEELLAQELAWLRDESFDLNLVGFDATELERLLAIADGEMASLNPTAPRTRFRSRQRSWSASRAISGCWAAIGCCAGTPPSWPMSSGFLVGSSRT